MSIWGKRVDSWVDQKSGARGKAAGEQPPTRDPVTERTPEQRHEIAMLKTQLAGYVLLLVGVIAAAVFILLLAFG